MRPSAFPGEKLSAPGLFCYCVALQATNIRQALASHCYPHSATKLSTSCKIGKCRGKVGRVQSKHCAQLSTPRPCLYHMISLAAGGIAGVEGLVINIAHNFILIFCFLSFLF